MRKRFLVGRVPLLLSLVTLAGSVAVGSPHRADDERTGQQLIGAWRLVWLEEPSSDGKVHKADCTGMLVFTPEGRMSVQVMYREPRVGADAGPVQYAQGGYEASFGRYAVDASGRTFTYHVEGALVRSFIGKELTRRFELSGNLLTVRSSDPKELWKVAWERYQEGDPR